MKVLVLLAFVGMVACGDNEHPGTPGIAVTAAPDLRTTETGGEALFMVALTGRPHADVVIPLRSTNITEGTVSPDSLDPLARTKTTTSGSPTRINAKGAKTRSSGASARLLRNRTSATGPTITK